MSAPTWNEDFVLFDGMYFVSDIQYYFEYIFKKFAEKTDSLSRRIYVNKIENRITSKIQKGYYLKFFTRETIKLLGKTKNKIIKMKTLKMYLIQKLLKQHQYFVILLTAIIIKIQESCIHFFIWSIVIYLTQKFYVFKIF